jgi:hypothetical protein
MPKDPVIRISNEADLIITNLKHEALIKRQKRVPKNGILDFIVINAPKCKEFNEAFWKWVNNDKR